MTISKLIKELQKIEKKHGRCEALVHKESLWDGNESWAMCSINSVEFMMVNVADDDGGCAYTKAGVERLKKSVVLKGWDS